MASGSAPCWTTSATANSRSSEPDRIGCVVRRSLFHEQRADWSPPALPAAGIRPPVVLVACVFPERRRPFGPAEPLVGVGLVGQRQDGTSRSRQVTNRRWRVTSTGSSQVPSSRRFRRAPIISTSTAATSRRPRYDRIRSLSTYSTGSTTRSGKAAWMARAPARRSGRRRRTGRPERPAGRSSSTRSAPSRRQARCRGRSRARRHGGVERVGHGPVLPILPAVTILNGGVSGRVSRTRCRRISRTNLHVITAGSISRRRYRPRRRRFPDGRRRGRSSRPRCRRGTRR